MNKEYLLDNTFILKESIFKKKKDPSKQYMTDSDIKSVIQVGVDLFSKMYSLGKKEGLNFKLSVFRESKYKVNKPIGSIGIGIIEGSKDSKAKEIIRSVTKEFKNTNKFISGVKIESLNGELMVSIKIKPEYYYWKE